MRRIVTYLKVLPLVALLGINLEAATPFMVANINGVSKGSVNENMKPITFNNKLYFAADDGTNGMEFWVYDGTNTPSMVNDINPSGSSNPQEFAIMNGLLYFQADDGTNGAELWKYDGTNAPSMVADIWNGGNSSPKYLTVFNDKLYFQATDGTNGAELWVYDGTNAPSIVADIKSGISGSYPKHLTVFNNKLYFQATDGTNGYELWVYDSTNAPLMVADIKGAGDSNPDYLTVFNNKLYFQADDGTNGMELWVYDGTNAPSMAANIYSGNSSSYPRYLTVFNNKLYFQASDGTVGYELYAYDGTNVTLVADISSGATGSSPSNFIIFDNNLYFQATDGTNGYELWVYDGVNAPSMTGEIRSGGGDGFPKNFAVLGERLCFYASTLFDVAAMGYQYELWNYILNDSPVITEGSSTSVTINEDSSPSDFSLTLNATDPENNAITWSISSNASHGSASVSATPTGTSQAISYTPTADFNGSDSFIVQAADTYGSNTITVNVTVTPLNDSPTITTNSGANVAITTTAGITHTLLLGSDVDDSAADITYTITSAPTLGTLRLHGAVTLLVGGTFTQKDINDSGLFYTAGSTIGSDSFGFSLADGGEDGATPVTGTFTINVVQPTISYTNTLVESNSNSGGVSGSIVMTLAGDTFTGDVVSANRVTASSATGLDGLSASFNRDSDTQITLTFTGSKNSHGSADSLSDIEIAFTDAAFTTYSAAGITDSTKSNLSLKLFDGIISGLNANSWNMVSTGNGYSLSTSSLESSYLDSSYKVWAYSGNSWSENPTTITPKTGLWVYPTSTILPFSGTVDTSNDMSNTAAQASYIKSLDINKWHLVGLPNATNWSDLISVTPNECSGFSIIFYYDSVNNTWNTSNSFPASSAIWVRHICN